jgi:hypothetical protein
VQRQSNVDPTFAAFVQRNCTFPCQCMQTSQTCTRHVLGLTFAKPSSCGPSSRTCTSRAGRPRSTADRAVRLRIVSSSVGTPGKQSMWISASRLLKVKIVVPLEMCGTWTCSDNRSLVHTYRIVSTGIRSRLHLQNGRRKCHARQPRHLGLVRFSPLSALTRQFPATC